MSATRWLRIKARAGRVLLGCLLLSVAASVLWYRRLSDDPIPRAPAELPSNDPKAEMVTRDFRHVETRMDRTIWVLESARAEMFENQARLHTVKVTWFGDPGGVTVVITSAEGKVDFERRKAELSGDVRIERADGAVISTEKLLWNDKTKVLKAPQPVVITTPDATFRGEGLDANLETESIKLRGRVQGEIRSSSLAKARPS